MEGETLAFPTIFIEQLVFFSPLCNSGALVTDKLMTCVELLLGFLLCSYDPCDQQPILVSAVLEAGMCYHIYFVIKGDVCQLYDQCKLLNRSVPPLSA